MVPCDFGQKNRLTLIDEKEETVLYENVIQRSGVVIDSCYMAFFFQPINIPIGTYSQKRDEIPVAILT